MKIVDYGLSVEFRTGKWDRVLLRVVSYWSLDDKKYWRVEKPSGKNLWGFKDKQSAVDAAMAYLATEKLKGEIE
ncbi:MAG: hypothetical protein U0K42_11995 [Bacteroidales bacterium]|nr:hypothetical protein [Bacteroidales bacterium]